ncbi:aminotransferase [Pseudooceanicola onchidii]|uniref:aminotransferase n=1 Tax=Pseudooceanicola onchidii TaxID=2562279 RepID=UPI0010AB2CBC|nr:aminotransferase [Pseudooceanicola onchidii]
MALPRTATTFLPPVMEARRWLNEATLPEGLELINVSQAAPVDPPPEPMRREIARIAMEEPQAHLYGPVLGLPALREEVAQQWLTAYGGAITADHVGITSGCNEAFCAAIATLVAEGDEVLLPVPWYFNHKMALDMMGARAVALPTDAGLFPDVEAAAARITDRTRAIALVSPNNPSGVEYPPELIGAFFDLCQARGIALILDETYRDFHSSQAAPHDLFTRPDWDRTLIQLYSFSKAYRLTGHRVGAILTGTARLSEVEKYLDTVTICPAQLGQYAALWGMRNLQDWLAGEREEILSRGAAIRDGFAPLADRGWILRGAGAYFAYADHPFDAPSDRIAQRLVAEAGILMLPGTMFTPEGDAAGKRQMRIAFANLDTAGIGRLIDRLAGFQG